KRTDHIPFVMLTAKAGDESKIEGLRSGADDYLIKPFNKTELVLKVQNLIVLRERLQIRIKNRLLSTADQIEVPSLEEQFIIKVRNFIEAHLGDETLTVEKLSSEMGLSREQCYRKVLAISGLSPSALIRSLRLQRAGQLLASRWGPVSQVAYEVGFSNLSHFSKAFREEFGKLPSEYANQD
ncbi:MAG TPA: helix-turn-helix domain-containing protein, partial [Cyclobacteriaceae bacterium]|nr:helix-turn-helix domain-containing protein [Cyclobacteriaceae bacterium]